MGTPKRIEFGPYFSKDLDEACDWYQKQSEGHLIDLSERLMDEVITYVDLIAEGPEQWVIWDEEDEIRRCNLRVFPYAILYWMPNEDTVELIAFAHFKRDPKTWIRPE